MGMITQKKDEEEEYKSRCCCMCGDHGLTHLLFSCNLCHFRSQHRYCSNLYPKADSYNVCNWCLIQKVDNDNNNDNDNLTTTTLISNNSSSNSSSPTKIPTRPKLNGSGPRPGPPTTLKPVNPLKKPKLKPKPEVRSVEARSPPLGRKRITAVHQGPVQQLNKFSNINSGGGPPVIKHVFRNKVRRYKLLDEVSG